MGPVFMLAHNDKMGPVFMLAHNDKMGPVFMLAHNDKHEIEGIPSVQYATNAHEHSPSNGRAATECSPCKIDEHKYCELLMSSLLILV